ncbi:MAG: TonB-dependent receptor, partial [Pseudomonadota bacterium]
GRFDFATSVFYNDTKDEHLQVFDLATFQSVIENADTESYGFELEAGYQATDAWRLEGALALLEAEITRSNDPTVSVGNDVPFAPSLSLGLAVEYASDLTLFNKAGEFSARAEYQYVGERQIDPQNRDVLDSYGIVNLRFGWQHNSTQIYAFADNVFDETYAESGFVFGNSPSGDLVSIGVPGQSRRIGLGVDMTF